MTKIRSTDGSNVQDRRGQGGGGGFSFPGLGRGGGSGTGFPIPTKVGGGGLIGLLVVAAVLILPRLLGGGSGGNSSLLSDSDQSAGVEAEQAEGAQCQTEIEQILCGAFNDVQQYWQRQYPASFGGEYEMTEMVWFDGGTETGCGSASSQTGPFYCPADHLVYFDIAFLEQLQSQLGATGDLATQYIVAHEVGHHVQTLRGTQVNTREEGIALELQADCFAGAWVYDADRRRNEAGEDLIDADELDEAVGAAEAVGDDAIQIHSQGRVDESQWTHGSSAQRVSWFRRGYSTGDPTKCTTFEETLS